MTDYAARPHAKVGGVLVLHTRGGLIDFRN
jgi:hypothetical protein